jgi:hypothetical protein
MAKQKKKKSSKKFATTFRLKNASLKGDFEVFLPEGWKVSKSTAKSSKRVPEKKSRKRT